MIDRFIYKWIEKFRIADDLFFCKLVIIKILLLYATYVYCAQYENDNFINSLYAPHTFTSFLQDYSPHPYIPSSW